MQAIKYIGEILENGYLSVPEDLKNKQGKKFEVILLEQDDISTRELMNYAQKSKSFDFLKEPAEEIYSIKDGKPL